MLEGSLYCCPQSLESALVAHVTRLQSGAPVPAISNRIPLGLLMVARGKLSYDQVQTALSAQQNARTGKIGEWFEKLGFATEQDVTAALGLQWGCPVVSSWPPDTAEPFPPIPLSILEAFQMWPLHRVAASNSLYMAFGERVDHGALYAVEKMLDCHALACVASRKGIALLLERMRQQARSSEIEFGPMRDAAEISRVALSYIAKVGAEEVRIARVGAFVWLVLKARSGTTNLVFRRAVDIAAQRRTILEDSQTMLTTSA